MPEAKPVPEKLLVSPTDHFDMRLERRGAVKRMIVGLAAVAFLTLFPQASWAQSERPDATLDFSGGSVAAGIGYTWGNGVLHFQGKDYRFTANGLSIVSVGVASIKATGNVYHLTKVADFPGNYVAFTGGIAVAGGVSGTVMKNQNGVVMNLRATDEGLQFELAPSGFSVALEGPPTPTSR